VIPYSVFKSVTWLQIGLQQLYKVISIKKVQLSLRSVNQEWYVHSQLNSRSWNISRVLRRCCTLRKVRSGDLRGMEEIQ